jgi:hypothetical protein
MKKHMMIIPLFLSNIFTQSFTMNTTNLSLDSDDSDYTSSELETEGNKNGRCHYIQTPLNGTPIDENSNEKNFDDKNEIDKKRCCCNTKPHNGNFRSLSPEEIDEEIDEETDEETGEEYFADFEYQDTHFSPQDPYSSE